jgi:hypothetical protein
MRPIWELMGWEVSPVFSKRETPKTNGPLRELNPGPPPPLGGIIPLDHVEEGYYCGIGRPISKLMGWEVSPAFSKRETPKANGSLWDLNPGPPSPSGGIITLDHVEEGYYCGIGLLNPM